MKSLSLLAFSLFVLSLPHARAEEGEADKSDQRQENQEKRIEQGVQSGELSKREAYRLKKQQKRIGNAEAKMEGDGKLTKEEAYKLNKMQNHASKAIKRQKHDRKRR